ncbi:hypothetical protein RUM44_013695 [Polyplax serrata]|uniref:Uncharacterized protein n=1 Tax=Polyplax serrata TaxID=468196 RepID=A0ABR1BGS4_POLSC
MEVECGLIETDQRYEGGTNPNNQIKAQRPIDVFNRSDKEVWLWKRDNQGTPTEAHVINLDRRSGSRKRLELRSAGTSSTSSRIQGSCANTREALDTATYDLKLFQVSEE